MKSALFLFYKIKKIVILRTAIKPDEGSFWVIDSKIKTGNTSQKILRVDFTIDAQDDEIKSVNQWFRD